MKISMNPMPKLIEDARQRIDLHFAGLAHPHRDAAHRQKREIACKILEAKPSGMWPFKRQPEITAEFEPLAQEAELRGLDVMEFARQIADKPDVVAIREFHRQKALLQIETAKSQEELEEILNSVGVAASLRLKL